MSTDLPRAKGQLGIPLSRQENSYSCGAAAVRSVLLKLGVDVKEKLLRDLLGTTPEDGTDPRAIIAFLKEIPGLRVDAGPMNVDELRRAVTFEVIVIIDLQAWSDDEEVDYQTTWNSGHYVVLSGFDRETLYFADPAADVTTTLPMGGLQERWHDEDIDGGRWGNLGISVSLDSILQDSPYWKTLVEAKIKKMSEKTASQSRVARVFAMKTALDAKKWGPFSFEIDRPKGFKKEWPQDDGTVKKYTYPVDYGYFIGHTGEDEEGLDAFVGDDPTGKIESFLKMKPSEDGETLVPDETKFLVGLTDTERKKVMGLYKPEEIVGLREYEDVYELVAALNAFRDRKKAAARIAGRVAARYLSAVAAKYEDIDFKPPKSVAEAARKGLEYREKASPSNKGGLTPAEASEQGIGSGVQRAVNLKNRDNVTPETISKMVGFFARHEKNKGVSAENQDEPWNDKGHVSWLLWGGDPGKTWAEKVKSQMEKADEDPRTASRPLGNRQNSS